MSKKKLAFYSIFFILIIFVTFYMIFSKNSINEMIDNLKMININYIFICFILIFLYFLLQGIFMKMILGVLNKKISLNKGIFYSIVEFFFSGITPSSTGGQPVQLYYMTKDKIPVRKSFITLLLNTIYFKLFLVIFSIFIFVFKSNLVFNYGGWFTLIFFIGLIVDIIVSIVCYLVIFNQPVIKKLLTLVYRIIDKIMKNDHYKSKLEDSLVNYKREADILRKHNREVIISLIITFIQRIILFTIPYVIYRSFGFNEFSYFDLLLIQICIQISIEAIPLPGGTGVSEHFINLMYVSIFGAFASTGMILNRMFSFYIPLLVILFIVILVTKFSYGKNKSGGK